MHETGGPKLQTAPFHLAQGPSGPVDFNKNNPGRLHHHHILEKFQDNLKFQNFCNEQDTREVLPKNPSCVRVTTFAPMRTRSDLSQQKYSQRSSQHSDSRKHERIGSFPEIRSLAIVKLGKQPSAGVAGAARRSKRRKLFHIQKKPNSNDHVTEKGCLIRI